MALSNIIQLSEFDVTQKIIESLSNVCTRAVLFSVKNESKDATQIADELKLSLSTVYKTLSSLEKPLLVAICKRGQFNYTRAPRVGKAYQEYFFKFEK